MHLIDWLLVILPVVTVASIAFYTQRYMHGVSDFMSGGRLAGRYLLTVAKSEMQAGAVVFVAAFELFARSGFVTQWWINIIILVNIAVAMSGFVIYRFRETRALTLAQFFEARYNRSFRLCMGVLAFVAGVLNFGIIPLIGTRFFIYFLDLPTTVSAFGYIMPTEVPLMALFLSISVAITVAGGLVTLMVADCLEGMISQVLYLLIVVVLIGMFDWSQVMDVLRNVPAGYSMINPFDAHKVEDFNFWFMAMTLVLSTYGTMAFQNASAYNAAARTPHESRIGAMLARLREQGKVVVIVLLAICAVTFLKHPDFAQQAAEANATIAGISDPQRKLQMEVPIALSHLLPIGVKGALCVILLMGVFGGDSTHLHSWGGILVQDVIMPLRKKKKPLTPRQHVFLLRLAMAGVAVFAFIFGCLFQVPDFINMWWQVTTAIFVGGAGAAIIGGLYWKKGTTAGAWTAVAIGSTLSGGGIILRQIYGREFPVNGAQIAFGASVLAIFGYVIVSLLTCRQEFDLEAMLHRKESGPPKVDAGKPWWMRWLGFDSNYTKADRWIAGGLLAWSTGWASVVIVGTAWNLVSPWSDDVWSSYWKWVGFGLPLFLCTVIAVWFTWGGLRDLKIFFRELRTHRVDPNDNGAVHGVKAAPGDDPAH
jgi:SSS family solute:Na+ symporter